MPCIFCDQTPDTVNAVETLDRIRKMLWDTGHPWDEPLNNFDLLAAVYEKIQEVHRLRRGLANAGQEHDRQAAVISELQKTVEEYQLRDGRQEARDARTGGLHRWQKPWNNTRMWEGQ